MPAVMVSCKNPRYLADDKVVDAFIRFTGTYVAGGVVLTPRDFGLSQITDVDDAIVEGFVLRWAEGAYPHKVQLFGKDSISSNQTELATGYDISGLDNARLRIYGW